jgi:ferredoxin
MSIEIYYFSGTGNSLFVAKELQKRIPDSKVIPMVGLLHQEVIQTTGKSIGFVFPVHALTIPIAVKRFLKKTDFRSAEYIFAIATRGGTFFRGFEKMTRILKKKNKRLDAQFILNMYMNDPRDEQYQSPTADEISVLESAVLERLDSIQTIIVDRKISREKDSDYPIDFSYHPFINYLLEKFVLFAMTVSEYIGGVNYFEPDSKCTGCGICEKVCLSGKIKMMDKKPLWQKKVLCYMCYACVNFCPEQSVQINDIPGVKSHTRKSGRYSHPFATVKDIAGEKQIESRPGSNNRK